MCNDYFPISYVLNARTDVPVSIPSGIIQIPIPEATIITIIHITTHMHKQQKQQKNIPWVHTKSLQNTGASRPRPHYWLNKRREPKSQPATPEAGFKSQHQKPQRSPSLTQPPTCAVLLPPS